MSIPGKENRLATSEAGAAMVEYAMMIALIVLVVFGAVTALGQSLSAFFTDAASMLPD